MTISEFIDSLRSQGNALENFDELIERSDNEDEQAMCQLGLLYENLLEIAENADDLDVDLCDDLRDAMEDYMYNSAELGYIEAQEWVNNYRDDDDGKWDAYI
ncbi:hypothetical protein LJC25_03775 [Bacteroidales bacterium OttesenSCG-928-K03]|nr:hypothetical protein [Bacteroidales bacterium OttesenSCG-928-L14]MDL2240662.1 hypothetical protein [Bacteroidales bacterium OttesenSCG-928-K22]MDL2242830.1 hypothetical protein [Bacteroidales bacterium OttesenSCG-928-K03]